MIAPDGVGTRTEAPSAASHGNRHIDHQYIAAIDAVGRIGCIGDFEIKIAGLAAAIARTTLPLQPDDLPFGHAFRNADVEHLLP